MENLPSLPAKKRSQRGARGRGPLTKNMKATFGGPEGGPPPTSSALAKRALSSFKTPRRGGGTAGGGGAVPGVPVAAAAAAAAAAAEEGEAGEQGEGELPLEFRGRGWCAAPRPCSPGSIPPLEASETPPVLPCARENRHPPGCAPPLAQHPSPSAAPPVPSSPAHTITAGSPLSSVFPWRVNWKGEGEGGVTACGRALSRQGARGGAVAVCVCASITLVPVRVL